MLEGEWTEGGGVSLFPSLLFPLCPIDEPSGALLVRVCVPEDGAGGRVPGDAEVCGTRVLCSLLSLNLSFTLVSYL